MRRTFSISGTVLLHIPLHIANIGALWIFRDFILALKHRAPVLLELIDVISTRKTPGIVEDMIGQVNLVDLVGLGHAPDELVFRPDLDQVIIKLERVVWNMLVFLVFGHDRLDHSSEFSASGGGSSHLVKCG